MRKRKRQCKKNEEKRRGREVVKNEMGGKAGRNVVRNRGRKKRDERRKRVRKGGYR